jgi:GDP-L-fucose synthase
VIEELCPSYVFICAARVGGIKANAIDNYGFLRDNLLIQAGLIHACIKHRVRKVVFLGSACIYPKKYNEALREEFLLTDTLETTNEGYSLAKIAGLKACEYANKQFTTKFISLMPCNLYGENDNFITDNSHVIPALIRKIKGANGAVEIWGSGKARREFMHVDDLADCMIWAMRHIKKTDTFLNVGTGEDISIKSLAELIAKEIGYEVKFIYDKSKPDGVYQRKLDISKLTKLGWKSKIGLKQGIKRVIEHYDIINK